MIKVNVVKLGNYPVSTLKLKKALSDHLSHRGIVSDSEVGLAIVGEKKMLEIGSKFLKDKVLHNVLSFPEGETKAGFVYPPKSRNYLGEIILCYPKVVEDAKRANSLIEDLAIELVCHSGDHLMGIHHS